MWEEIKKALQLLTDQLKEIKQLIQGNGKRPEELLRERWLDGQDAMLVLKISPRTLQTLRDTGMLPYSRIQNKFFYKVSDINALLESNYIRNHLTHSHD